MEGQAARWEPKLLLGRVTYGILKQACSASRRQSGDTESDTREGRG